MEVSLTQIFDRPLRGREFFEEIIRDNLDLGRPDRIQLVFERAVTKKTPGEFRTRVIQDGVHPSLHIEYKNFDLKQYFKEGRGCRTEGTFRNPKDFGVNKGLSNLPYLQQIGRQINRRLLEVERVSHNSGLSGDSIQRVVQPARRRRVVGWELGWQELVTTTVVAQAPKRCRRSGCVPTSTRLISAYLQSQGTTGLGLSG